MTSVTVGMFSTFRLVLAPLSHSFLDVQNWGRREQNPTSRYPRVRLTCHTLPDSTTLDTARCTNFNVFVIASNYGHLSRRALLTTVCRYVNQFPCGCDQANPPRDMADVKETNCNDTSGRRSISSIYIYCTVSFTWVVIVVAR